MAKPNSHLDWTVGNPNFGTVTVEPTTGKKVTGWTPGEAPPPEFFNWLFFNADQWDKYFEATTDAINTRLTTVEGSLFSTNLTQESVGTGDGVQTQFTMSQAPSSPTNLFVHVNGLLVDKTTYTVSGRNLIFNSGSVPDSSADVMVVYIIQTGFSGQTVQSIGTGQVQKVETRTLTTSEVASGQLTLLRAPFDATAVLIDVIEDGPQAYGTDYSVSGNVISWSGLGMAPAVGAGSILRIQYFI